MRPTTLRPESWQKCCDAFPDAYRLGVTATPERLDGKALRPWFSELICGPGTWDLMQAGHLSECKIRARRPGLTSKSSVSWAAISGKTTPRKQWGGPP